MKKLVTGIAAGLVLGIFLGRIDWPSLMPFDNCTFGVSTPDVKPYVDHFDASVPEFSSDHFFFMTGFGDTVEYWSFVLPPEYARAFLDRYVKMHSLPKLSSDASVSELVKAAPRPYVEHRDWRPSQWFNSPNELSEVYYKDHLFCGYDAKKNRIYLMKWSH